MKNSDTIWNRSRDSVCAVRGFICVMVHENVNVFVKKLERNVVANLRFYFTDLTFNRERERERERVIMYLYILFSYWLQPVIYIYIYIYNI
jgi:hypothetical protein